MGICANKSQSQATDPPQNQRLQRIYNQYLQVFNISHPLNVNHKYNNYFTLIPDKHIGNGIKKTNQYTSRLSKEEWLEKRKEFWESRVEGEQNYWLAIKKAVEEPDELSALAILNASDLKLISNSIQLLYDHHGHKFDVPVFMINEPQSFPIQKSFDNNLIEHFDNNVIKLKIRCARLPKDFELDTVSTQSIVDLKKIIMEEGKQATCRLFLNGRELHDHHLLGNYQLCNGTIIQAFM